MKKVNVSLSVNDYFLKTSGYLNNNILSFNDKDKLNTNIIYDINNDMLIRDNKEITIKISFKEEDNNIEYYLKEQNFKINNKLDSFKLIKENNIIIINYIIDNNIFDLKISYEIRSENHDK